MPTFEETIDNATAWDGETDKRVAHGILCQAIDRNGTTLLKHASGTTHITPSAPPITFDATFLLASCTKLFTSICALQCVERGQIGLDEPLDAHLPEICTQPLITLEDPSIDTTLRRPSTTTAATTTTAYSAADPSTVKLSFKPRGARPLTLRHLLTHASGLAHDLLHPTVAAWRAAHGRADSWTGQNTDVVHDYSVPLVYEPGRGWSYGPSTDWAGKLVERLNSRGGGGGGGGGDGGGQEGATTTMNLEDYMRKNLFEPLGMRDSTFLLGSRPDVEARLMQTAEQGKGEGGEGLGEMAEVWMPREPKDCLGGSGLYTTVGDYLKVLEDLMQEQPKTLKKETVDLMFTPQLSDESRKSLRASMELMGVMIGGMVPENVRLDHGLGGLLVVDDNPNTGMKGGTMTWAGHGNLLWFVNRTANDGKGVAAFFGTQVMPSAGEEISKLTKQFIQEVWKRVE
ncbi:Acyltransferase mlcH [Lasiodiplodia theobromae]|uniref:Acyltransferase mlcH n=1 Tax=Lasiodiplodia theobromae TaxID=45133 RepID=A0A5N5DLZ0_9PEZI|nr:Acyltransferase mlcH [Lasiodiplodia theobromae]